MNSRYSNIIHKSQLLNFQKEHNWLTPKQVKDNDQLNGILNRIMFTITMINFILSQRDIHVNDFRKKMNVDEKLGDTWQHLILYTESYFSYGVILLNAIAELVYALGDNFPKKVNGDFTELWFYIRNNKINEKDFNIFFKNKMNWYEVDFRLPRNKLVIHDTLTSGFGMADHEIDIYVGKNSNVSLEKRKKATKILLDIINTHPEFNSPSILASISADSFNPVYRQIIQRFDLLNNNETKSLRKACNLVGFDFPYIPLTTPKLQEFLNFIDQWLINKFQLCPKCKQDYLHRSRFLINPNIRHNDPNNLWFGRICPKCHYSESFC